MANEKKHDRVDDHSRNHSRQNPSQVLAAAKSKLNDMIVSPVRRLISNFEWMNLLGSTSREEIAPVCVQQTPLRKPEVATNDHFRNQSIKEILFEIYHKSNRHDIKNLVLDALLVLFERAYDDQRTQIVELDDYTALTEIVTEIRNKLIVDVQDWRQRQWYGLFIEKLTAQMKNKCPAHVLLMLFSQDMFDLANDKIVLIRQLYPRIVGNLNAGYLNHSDCKLPAKEMFSQLLMRLADLAFEDSDLEVQRSAREIFATIQESDA